MKDCVFRNCLQTCKKLFNFPANFEARCKWIIKSGNEFIRPELKELKACALHFSSDQFQNDTQSRLNRNAIPNNCWLDFDNNDAFQTFADKSKICQEQNNKCNKCKYWQKKYNSMKKRYANLKKKISNFVQIWPKNTKKLSPGIKAFIDYQLKEKSFNKYPQEFRDLSVKLYFNSPSGYRLLKSLFKLPTVQSIKNWLLHHKFKPGLDSSLMEILKPKAWTHPN